MNLPALPEQPGGIAWPTESWQRSNAMASNAQEFDQLTTEVFDLEGRARGVTYALLIVKNGRLVFERYDAGANPFYLQYSWSMAKSITQALVGLLVKQGSVDIHEPVDIPEWQDDERSQITMDHLLRMSSGLQFREDYGDGDGDSDSDGDSGGASDVIPMLMFDGRHDTGLFAIEKPLVHKPDTFWSYSSGTTNIICRIIKDVIGDGASGMLRFMNDELFEPIGIRTATPKFDTSGTFIGSSFLQAIPQDFARFGLLYLRGGTWDGREILTPEWVDYARTVTYQDEEQCYGAHWWMNPANTDQFYCSGFDGQRILCDPERDLVLVRLGRTPADQVDFVWNRLYRICELL